MATSENWPFMIPEPQSPRIGDIILGESGVRLRAMHYFDTFYVTVIDAAPFLASDVEKWGDIAQIDVAVAHMSPLGIESSYGRTYRNWRFWPKGHFQNLEVINDSLSLIRYWIHPVPDLRLPVTNIHMVNVLPEYAIPMKRGVVLEMTGHSFAWVLNDGSVDSKGHHFRCGNECPLFMPDSLAIHDLRELEGQMLLNGNSSCRSYLEVMKDVQRVQQIELPAPPQQPLLAA